MSCLITMSQRELDRLEAVQKIPDRRLTVIQATALLDLSRSQIYRLLQAYDKFGSSGLVSGRRGRPSNRRYTEDFRNTVLDLVRAYYRDFGSTLACEKLAERHQLSVSKETLRQWMTAAGLWTSRSECKRQLHQPRGRRDCFGELSQTLTLRYDKGCSSWSRPSLQSGWPGRRSLSATIRTAGLRSCTARTPCPTERLTSFASFTGHLLSRTSGWMTCFQSCPRCRPVGNCSAARVVRGERDRRTICLQYPMAVRSMDIRSVSVNRVRLT